MTSRIAWMNVALSNGTVKPRPAADDRKRIRCCSANAMPLSGYDSNVSKTPSPTVKPWSNTDNAATDGSSNAPFTHTGPIMLPTLPRASGGL